MNVRELINKIRDVASDQPIQTVFDGDVYSNWNSSEIKYGSVNIALQNITYNANLCTYTMVLYYGDRLLQDRRNVNNVYSDGVTILQSIINTLNQEINIDIDETVNYVPFEQKFMDYLAGVYCTIDIMTDSELGLCGISDMENELVGEYLKFTALEDGSVISFTQAQKRVEYTFDGRTWITAENTEVTPNVIELDSGEAVMMRSTNGVVPSFNSGISGNVKVSGNINTVNDYNAADLGSGFELTPHCYYYMFANCDGLTDASELVLPSMTLANGCYYGMFVNSSNLEYVPSELPATVLAESCYNRMFYGCSSMTTAPELPATTLASKCYAFMFQECARMAAAPALPATTAYDACYNGMFEGCTSLTEAPVIPITALATDCFKTMFKRCTGLTVAPELPVTTLKDGCYEGMFEMCTGLRETPVLPATVLANSCYRAMFSGCTYLDKVICLATINIEHYCTTEWLKNVAVNGTFYKAASMSSWLPNSPSGIPTGWTVANYQQ